jgi:arylsulfatase
VPKVEPPEPGRYPECKDYWDRGIIGEFTAPYYGFQTVDYVGGHTSWVYGDYIRWLHGQGGAPEMLQPAEPLGDDPASFRMKISEELHYNRYVADSVIELIEDCAAPHSPPFFAWCSFPDPHAPVGSPEPYCDMYDPEEVRLPSRREGELQHLPPVYERVKSGELKPNGVDSSDVSDASWRDIIAGTYGMISHLDTEVGRVMDALERAGLADNTIVAFISDHGDMMGDHGLLWKSFYTFQGCIRLPLIVAAPGCPGGRVSDALVSQVDLMPAVLDLCDVPMPGEEWREVDTPYERGSVVPLRTHPGRSWRPLLDGSENRLRDEVVIENDDPTCGFQVRTLVTDRYRLTIYPGTPHGELFDLQADPDELHNLWYRAEQRSLRADLSARLLDAYARSTPLYPIPPWNA